MPSFIFFSVLFGSYEKILCLWHHPEVSSIFASSSYTVTVWEGVKHLFFIFFLFLLRVWAPNYLWRKLGTMLRNYRTECFLGLSASLDFKKKFQNQKNNKEIFLEERLWPRSPTYRTDWVEILGTGHLLDVQYWPHWEEFNGQD